MDNRKVAQDPQLLRMIPMGQYEFVDATFAAADTDTLIPYTTLKPEDPNSVRWLDITNNGNGVYRAANPNRVSWAPGYVILRAAVAGSTRLLLFLERN